LDRLGRVLLRQGRITIEQYEHAKRLQVESTGAMKLGEAFVELGYLSRQEVDNAVQLQVTNILVGLSEWREGEYSFLETTRLPAEYARVAVNTPDLIFWAFRRLEVQEDFRSHLPSARMILHRSASGERVREQLSLTSFEEQILGMADGQRRLGELLSIGKLGHVDVARVLYSFLSLGILMARPEGQAETPVTDEVLAVERRGDLSETPVAALLARIWLAGASGRVHLLRDKEWRELHFDRGRVVWTASSRPSHRLGDVLVAVGKVSQDEVKQAVEIKAKSPERRLGSILLEMRAVTLEELNWSLRFQAQRITLEVLTWTDGVFAYEARDPSDDQMITLPTSTPDLILEGVRRNPAPASVYDLIRSSDSMLLKAWDPVRVARYLKLGRNELRLLDALETGRTPREVLSLGIMEEEELARTLHALLSLEVVKAVTGTAAAEPESKGTGEYVNPGDLVGDLAADDTPPPDFGADEDTGVIALGAIKAKPEDATRYAIECEALRAENARLKARIRSLEAALVKAASGDRGASQSALKKFPRVGDTPATGTGGA
jgi:hypothetical protein